MINDIINTSGNAFIICYAIGNTLHEITNSNEVIVKVNPYESIIRRFYLAADYNDFNSCSIYVEANVDGVAKHDFEIKCEVNKDSVSLGDFTTNCKNILLGYDEAVLGNVVPIDVLLTSKSNSEANCSLLLDVTVIRERMEQ